MQIERAIIYFKLKLAKSSTYRLVYLGVGGGVGEGRVTKVLGNWGNCNFFVYLRQSFVSI